MREILFRGKTKDGRWVYGDLWNRPYAQNTICIVSFTKDTGIPGEAEVIPETVGQYTGLKDENGVKIFEGDVVEFEHGGRVRAYVIYKDGSFEVKNDKADVFLYLCVIDHKAEVIGNIHEHNHLLG